MESNPGDVMNKMKLVLLGMLVFASSTISGDQLSMILPIVEVHDGDTIRTNLTWRLPPPLNVVDIRVRGIDTPEMPADSYATTGKLGRAECVKEAELALKAKEAVVQVIKTTGATKMRIENFEHDKYGGRIVADVNIGGVNISSLLLEKKLAISYNGEAKTHNWCE